MEQQVAPHLEGPGVRFTPTALVLDALSRLRAVERTNSDIRLDPWPEPRGLRGRWHRRRHEHTEVRSARSGHQHDLSGTRGVLELAEDARPWFSLLAAVEPLGVGRKTSYGLGRYRLEWVRG